MRTMILTATAAFLMIGGSAMASSIEKVDSRASVSANSIMSVNCNDCAPLQPPVAKQIYKVPELKSGAQSSVVKEIDGEQKVVRTEVWVGGSPVVFISKATPEALASANIPAEGLDLGTMTGAVTPEPKPSAPAKAPLDTSKFELRTN